MKHVVAKFLLVVVLAVATVPLLPVKTTHSSGWPVFDVIADTVRSLMYGMQSVDHAANVADRAGAVATKAVLTTSDASCEALYTSYKAANIIGSSTESVTSAALSVVGGGSGDLVSVSAKLVAINTAIASVHACIVAARTAVSGTPTVTAVATASLIRWAPIEAALEQSRDQLLRELKASAKDIIKAFMIKTILTVSKNLTTEMVNKMVEKYKISDYMAYADAVSTQVYSMKYINDNFAGDARQQMMVRSMLQSEKFPEKIKTVQSFANSKAQEYLGTACGVGAGANSDDQNVFLKCLAAYGAKENDPKFHFLDAASQAQAAKASANVSTQAELSQSAGFAPPRNCSGSLAAQQQIDTQYEQAYIAKDVAVAVALQLEKAFTANPPQTTKAEYDKARAARDQALANVEALRGNVVVGADGKTSNSPIIDICSAIDSPAQFVSSSINSYLSKHFNESSQLKSENLPFYASFLSDVASNFLTNILTGKKTSQVFKEAGAGALQGGLIGIATSGANIGTGAGGTSNPAGDVEITAYEMGVNQAPPTTNLVAGKSYMLVADFSEISSNNPYRVAVTGFNTSQPNRLLTGSEKSSQRYENEFRAGTSGFTATLTFYYKGNDQGEDIPIGPYTESFTVARVNGVSTLLLRGPEISPR